MTARFDRVALIAGIAVAAVGVVLLLDQEDVIGLSLGVFAAIASAAVGVILVASGLADERSTEGADR